MKYRNTSGDEESGSLVPSSHIATLYGVAIASVIFPFSGYLETATSVLCYGVPEWGRPDVPHTRQGAF